MRAALIEQDDIAAGTSSRSSRLIHGGLRYLEQFRFGLVREALAERSRLLAIAPHLVKIESLLFPIYGIPFAHTMFYDAGLTLYDMLGARRDGGWHRRLSKAATLELAPTLRPEGLHGGLIYNDGVEDDARYTLAVVRTAQAAGGVAVTRVRATGLQTDGTFGVIQAVDAEDLMTGADAPYPDPGDRRCDRGLGGPARPSVPWSVAGHPAKPRRAPGRPARADPNKTGLTIRVPGKVVFLVPWPDHWLIGTTDAPFDGPPDHPSAAGWEVDRLLDTVNSTMDVGLTRDDVVGTYAGLRPLIAPSDGSTVKASREHRVTVESNGVVRIGGGKYTTYRLMARDAIDTVLGPEDAEEAPERDCRTPAGRGGRRSCPDADRWRTLDDRGRSRHRPGDCHPAGRPSRYGRHGSGGTRCRTRPAAPTGPGAILPRGRGRLGRPPGNGALPRRRAGTPDAARSGAARPWGGDRATRRADRRRSSSAGVHRASSSRSTRFSRRLAANTRCRLPIRRDRRRARCRPRSTEGHRTRTSSTCHRVDRIIGEWSPWPTCSAPSSTVCTRTGSRSRSARSSSRSSSS